MAVIKAMTHDFVLHPDQFVGLTIQSSYTDFQAYFHNAQMHTCPRPCLPMEQACVPYSPSFPGMSQINALRLQRVDHPDWYPELSSKSTDQDFAKVLYQRGTPGVPRVCEADEAAGHFVDMEEAMSQEAQLEKDKVQSALEEVMAAQQREHVRSAIKGVSVVSSAGGDGDGWIEDGSAAEEDGSEQLPDEVDAAAAEESSWVDDPSQDEVVSVPELPEAKAVMTGDGKDVKVDVSKDKDEASKEERKPEEEPAEAKPEHSEERTEAEPEAHASKNKGSAESTPKESSEEKPTEADVNKDKIEEASEEDSKPEEPAEAKPEHAEADVNKGKIEEASEEESKPEEPAEAKPEHAEADVNKGKIEEASEEESKPEEPAEAKPEHREADVSKDKVEASEEERKPEEPTEAKPEHTEAASKDKAGASKGESKPEEPTEALPEQTEADVEDRSESKPKHSEEKIDTESLQGAGTESEDGLEWSDTVPGDAESGQGDGGWQTSWSDDASEEELPHESWDSNTEDGGNGFEEPVSHGHPDWQEFHHQEPQAIDGHHETWTVHHVWEDGSQEGDDEGTWSESDEGGEVEGDDSMDLGSDGIGDDFQEVERPDTGGFEFDSTPYDDRVMASQACFHTGRSFSLLDAPEHTPSSVKDRTACKAQCAKVHTAAHFVFHEPTKLCHCPPKGVIKTEVGPEFIGGDVGCSGSNIMKKNSMDLPKLGGGFGTTGVASGLMVLVSCGILGAVVALALRRGHGSVGKTRLAASGPDSRPLVCEENEEETCDV
ncbi:Midasin (Dynein-related AAA-ATPase mdn1) (MIDAS-containing protein) [Durusdinium trenchii]